MTRRVTAALALGVLVLAGLNLKMRLSTDTPRFDPEDESAYFRTESAFQYRYARLAAAGRALPEPDTAAQYPEGVSPRRELTSVMERLTGLSYRLLGRGTEFRWFVLLWVALVSSLSIVAFYFCAARLTTMEAALAGAAAYGLSWAAQCNVIASYRLETLGLPLMFGSLACLGALLDEKEKRPHAFGAAAAALLVAAFATWHLSRFYLATLLAALAYAYWRTRAPRLKLAAGWMLASGLVSLLLVPSARASLFIASPAAYGHVYGLVWAKLRHGLAHPADPALLSPVQRLEWTGPSDSPDPGFAVFAFVPLALVLLPRLRARAPRAAFGETADALFFVYLAGTILASRLTPWLAFFLVLAACRAPHVLFFSIVAALEGLKCLAPASPLNPFLALSAPLSSPVLRPAVGLDAERQVLGWLRRYGGPDRPALAPMGLSAEILSYTDTPVLLQPKWEAASIRTKTADYVRALFGSEKDLAAYMERYGAKLLVFGADTILDETPEGLRYAAAVRDVEGTAAYLLQFAPEKLSGFRLVFQNEDFRVFSREPNKKEPYPKLAVYDRAEYGPSLDCKSVLQRMQAARLKLVLARVLAKMGRGEESLSAYDESFAAWPPDAAVREEYNSLKARLR